MALFYGSFLFVWIYINSLQLFVYTVLLRIPLPTNVSYLLESRFLGLLRLINFQNNDRFFGENGTMSRSYSLDFIENLTPLFYISAVISILWVLTYVLPKLCYAERLGLLKYKCHVSVLLNCLTRVFYEMFLEINLCAMISLSYAQDQIGNFFLALCTLWLLLMALSMLIVILIFNKGGP